MIIIVDGLLVGLGIGLGLLVSRSKGLFRPRDPNDIAQPYTPLHSVHCPKCSFSFDFTGHDETKFGKYCECVEYPVGHFHFRCYGCIYETDRGFVRRDKKKTSRL